MRFTIEWEATVGRYLVKASSVEQAEAPTASQALNLVRSSIIAKLASLSCKFRIDNIRFPNQQLSPQDHFNSVNFINSLNVEGGLAENIPRSAPMALRVSKDKNGNATIMPLYGTPLAGP